MKQEPSDQNWQRFIRENPRHSRFVGIEPFYPTMLPDGCFHDDRPPNDAFIRPVVAGNILRRIVDH